MLMQRAGYHPLRSLCLTLLCFAVFAALCSGALLSRDNEYLIDYPGVADIKVGTSYDNIYRLAPGDLAVYRQNRQRMVNLLLTQPGAKAPHGISLAGLVRACPPLALDRPDHPIWPVPTICIVHFNSIFRRNGKPGWGNDSPVEMTVYMNDPENAGFQNYGGGIWKDSKGRTIFYQANQVGNIQGYPLYWPRNQGDKEILILSQNRKPIWSPLSQEEFLNVWIRFMEKDLAEMGEYGKDPSNLLRRRLERHRAVLAAMSPAERKAQAKYLRNEDDPFEPDLALKGSQYAWPLVVVNPEWFDPALPRSAVQLISVIFNYGASFNPDDPKPDEDGNVESLRLSSMKATSDWKAIGSLLGH